MPSLTMDDGIPLPPPLPDATESFLADVFDAMRPMKSDSNDDADGTLFFDATTNSRFITASSELKQSTSLIQQEPDMTPTRTPRRSRSKLIMAAIQSRSADKKENVNPNQASPIAVASEPASSTKSNVVEPARRSVGVNDVDRMAAALNSKELRALATMNNKLQASEDDDEEKKKKKRVTEADSVAAKIEKKSAPRKSSRTSKKAARAPTKLSLDSNSKVTSSDGGAAARRNKKMWTGEEDEKLRQLIAKADNVAKKEGSEVRWTNVAKALGGGRTSKQCRERFSNHLRSDLVKGNWSPSEDKLLFQLQSIHGNSWATIRKQMPHRADNDIKNRWYSHQRAQKRALGREAAEPKQGPKKQKKKQTKREASVPKVAAPEARKSPPEEPAGLGPSPTALFPPLAAGRTPKDLFDSLDLTNPLPIALADSHEISAAFLLATQSPGVPQPLVQTPSERSHAPSSGVPSNFKWTPVDSVVEYVPL
jgi:hypothetical protein